MWLLALVAAAVPLDHVLVSSQTYASIDSVVVVDAAAVPSTVTEPRRSLPHIEKGARVRVVMRDGTHDGARIVSSENDVGRIVDGLLLVRDHPAAIAGDEHGVPLPDRAYALVVPGDARADDVAVVHERTLSAASCVAYGAVLWALHPAETELVARCGANELRVVDVKLARKTWRFVMATVAQEGTPWPISAVIDPDENVTPLDCVVDVVGAVQSSDGPAFALQRARPGGTDVDLVRFVDAEPVVDRVLDRRPP